MVIPIWVPLALAAASMGANYVGQKKTDKARGAALAEASRVREEKSREAEDAARKSADLFANGPEDEAAAAAKKEAAYKEATEGTGAQARLADIVSKISPKGTSYVAEEKAVADKSRAKLGARAKAMAALGSFGDVMVGNDIAMARNRADIGQAGTAMQNWQQNVLPLQMEAANMKGRNFHTLADALQAASMITGFAAMSSPAAGAGKAVTPAGESAIEAASAVPFDWNLVNAAAPIEQASFYGFPSIQQVNAMRPNPVFSGPRF